MMAVREHVDQGLESIGSLKDHCWTIAWPDATRRAFLRP